MRFSRVIINIHKQLASYLTNTHNQGSNTQQIGVRPLKLRVTGAVCEYLLVM